MSFIYASQPAEYSKPFVLGLQASRCYYQNSQTRRILFNIKRICGWIPLISTVGCITGFVINRVAEYKQYKDFQQREASPTNTVKWLNFRRDALCNSLNFHICPTNVVRSCLELCSLGFVMIPADLYCTLNDKKIVAYDYIKRSHFD